MCGRYVSTRGPEDLARHFGVTEWRAEDALEPSWSVAPADRVWAVLERAPRERRGDEAATRRELRPLRWGLVPPWARDAGIGARMINARVETVHEKPAFRRAFAARRCLLPADGFHEWQRIESAGAGRARKQPYFIRPEDGRVMAPAGLYEYGRDPAVARDDDPAAWLMTCTVITTDAAGRVHPRMPLALAPEHCAAWLDPRHRDGSAARPAEPPPADGRLEARPVSPAVNDVRDNGPRLLEEATP